MINKLDRQTLIIYFSLFLLISAQIFYIAGSLLANLSTLLFVATYIFLDSTNIRNFFFKKYKFLTLILSIYLFMNILTSEYRYFVTIKLIEYFRFILFGLSIVFFLKIIQKKIHIYIKFLLILIFFLVIDCFIQFYFGKDIFGYEYNNSYKRISGAFGDEWIIGSYLLYIGFLTVSYLNNYFKINNFNNHLLFSILAITILFTGERSSFLSIFYFLILMFIFSNKRKFIFLVSITIIILSLISINFNQNLKDKYNLLNLPTSENKSLNSISKEKNNLEKLDKNNFQNNKFQEFFNSLKNSKWSGHSYRAFQIFKDNILFGSGFRTYRYHCYKYDNNIDKKITKCSTHPHNFHSEIISDNGLLGYLIFAIFILSIFYFFLKKKLYKNFSLTIIFCLIITFIFPIKTTGSFFTTNSSFIFWVLIGHYFHLKSLKENINS